MTIVEACIRAMMGVGDVKAFWRIRETMLSNKSSQRVLKPFCSMIRRRYGAGIPVSEKVKPFVTPHAFHGIFISKYATVDEGCTIFQQVTIGQNGLIEGDNAPKIGANCYIGAGAKIIGPCTVGKCVRVGANAIVVEDIPPNTTVVLQKPRLIVRDNEGK